MKAKIISFINQKGGVGKTTTCLNVGAYMGRMGKQVLLIDTDAQASLTISAGVELEENDRTIYELLRGSATASDIIIHKSDYDIIPSDIRLSGIELEVAGTVGRERLLSEAIEDVLSQYDYILIDCPPNLSIVTLMALTASTDVIIPVQSQYLALTGMAQLLDTINLVKKRMNPGLKLSGILLTMFNNRKLLDKSVLENINENFKEIMFKTRISNNVALAEAPISGQNIFEYKISCRGAKQYAMLTEEIMKKI